MRRIGPLKQEAGTPIHPPTRKVKAKLQRRMVSVRYNVRRFGPTKKLVAMLPRAIAVVRIGCQVAVVCEDLLVNVHHEFPGTKGANSDCGGTPFGAAARTARTNRLRANRTTSCPPAASNSLRKPT